MGYPSLCLIPTSLRKPRSNLLSILLVFISRFLNHKFRLLFLSTTITWDSFSPQFKVKNNFSQILKALLCLLFAQLFSQFPASATTEILNHLCVTHFFLFGRIFYLSLAFKIFTVMYVHVPLPLFFYRALGGLF